MRSHLYTTDTSPEAEAVQLELVRRMAPSERVQKTFRLSSEMIRSAKAAIRRRHPDFAETQVAIKFIELCYGAELAMEVQRRLESAAH